MNKYKIYPWIPIVGIFLVIINFDKEIVSFEKPITFIGSCILQTISLIITISYLLTL